MIQINIFSFKNLLNNKKIINIKISNQSKLIELDFHLIFEFYNFE